MWKQSKIKRNVWLVQQEVLHQLRCFQPCFLYEKKKTLSWKDKYTVPPQFLYVATLIWFPAQKRDWHVSAF